MLTVGAARSLTTTQPSLARQTDGAPRGLSIKTRPPPFDRSRAAGAANQSRTPSIRMPCGESEGGFAIARGVRIRRTIQADLPVGKVEEGSAAQLLEFRKSPSQIAGGRRETGQPPIRNDVAPRPALAVSDAIQVSPP